MKQDEIGIHAKAWMGARHMIVKRAQQATDPGARALLNALADAAGDVGNSYYDIWRGCEPGTADVPFEPYKKPR